jgi:DNA-binding transcriptional LysR family regulator
MNTSMTAISWRAMVADSGGCWRASAIDIVGRLSAISEVIVSLRPPSLISLQMLEASARLGSFTRAAQELSVTESAICRQVIALERRFGVQFFHRIKKRIVLTPEGDRYVREIRDHLHSIERATQELASRAGGMEVIELAVVPTFATQWLIPRLGGLIAAQPRLILNVASRTEPFHFNESRFDAAIYFGNALWPGTAGRRLMEEGPSIPVCSPRLLRGTSRIRTRADLVKLPLLHLATRPDAWPDWVGGNDEALRLKASLGFRYDLFTMVVGAAIAGTGVALLPRMLICDALEQGTLVQPVDAAPALAGSEGAYFLSHRDDRVAQEKLQGFLDWLDIECPN